MGAVILLGLVVILSVLIFALTSGYTPGSSDVSDVNAEFTFEESGALTLHQTQGNVSVSEIQLTLSTGGTNYQVQQVNADGTLTVDNGEVVATGQWDGEGLDDGWFNAGNSLTIWLNRSHISQFDSIQTAYVVSRAGSSPLVRDEFDLSARTGRAWYETGELYAENGGSQADWFDVSVSLSFEDGSVTLRPDSTHSFEVVSADDVDPSAVFVNQSVGRTTADGLTYAADEQFVLYLDEAVVTETETIRVSVRDTTTGATLVHDVISGMSSVDSGSGVSASPDAGFSVDAGEDMSGIVEDSFAFAVETTGVPDGDVSSYTWHFGDGTTATGPDVTHQYAAGGEYRAYVVVETEDGQTAADALTVAVRDVNYPPVADAGEDKSGNADEQFVFDGSDTSDPNGDALTYEWTLDDGEVKTGEIISHSYSTGRTYDVTLTVTDPDGASDSDTVTVDVNGVPSATLRASSVTPDVEETVHFDGSRSTDPENDPLVYEWDFDDGTTSLDAEPTHTYPTAGTYTVTLTVTDDKGATDTVSTDISVNDGPQAVVDANRTSVNRGESIQFDGSGSTDPEGDAITYHWDFGNGNTSTDATPIHAYATPGEYTTVLTVTDRNGATDTSEINITVNGAPTAVATADATQVNEGEDVLFDGTGSTDPEGDALTYDWDFGDDAEDDSATVYHAYSSGGEYTAILDVTDPSGAYDTAEITITVNGAPTAVATADSTRVNEGESVHFDATSSTDPEGDALSYAWEFGDGASKTGPTPSHSYTSSGTYTATVTVTDADGASSTETVTIEVNQAPTAAASASQTRVNEGESIQFDGTGSSDPDGETLSYEWAFGDGSTATGDRPTHSYSTDGTYTATLTVTDADGVTDTDTLTITVNGAPTAVATANPTDVNADENIQFDGTGSSDPDGDTLSYTWDFDDGSGATGDRPTHSYSSSGTYTATLTVTDPDGRSDTDTVTIAVNGAPIASISADATRVVEGEYITFDGGNSYDPDGDALSYEWEFGDGHTVTGENPMHVYHSYGEYAVVLTVTDDHGLSTSATVIIDVNTMPTAIADVDSTSITAGESVQFDGSQSYDAKPGIESYEWFFNDGNSATGATASHTYDTPGVYTAVLSVTDGAGNTNTDSVTVEVAEASPYTGWDYRREATVTNQMATSLSDQTVRFETPVSSAMQADYDDVRVTWINGDGEEVEVPYYVEYDTSSYVSVQASLPNLDASGTETMYIYYGNDGADNAESPNQVLAKEHNFREQGLTSEWDAWGRAHSISGSGLYNPASMDNGRVRLTGQSCSYRGVLTPTDLPADYDDWELFLQVEGDGYTRNAHDTRISQGVTLNVQHYGNYNDDYSSLANPRIGMKDHGSGLKVAGITDPSGFNWNHGDENYLRMKLVDGTLKLKYWKVGTDEPESWDFVSSSVTASGRPSPNVVGTCKGNSRHNWVERYNIHDTVTDSPDTTVGSEESLSE